MAHVATGFSGGRKSSSKGEVGWKNVSDFSASVHQISLTCSINAILSY